MRLYTNSEESRLLLIALTKEKYVCELTGDKTNAEKYQSIIERVELCRELQKREKKAKEQEESEVLYHVCDNC